MCLARDGLNETCKAAPPPAPDSPPPPCSQTSYQSAAGSMTMVLEIADAQPTSNESVLPPAFAFAALLVASIVLGRLRRAWPVREARAELDHDAALEGHDVAPYLALEQ